MGISTKGKNISSIKANQLALGETFRDFAFGEICCFRTQEGHRKYILDRVSFR